jgi:two-component system, NarL family, nitrate/nitrite response regulator NarL
VNVVICDDHRLFSDALATVLSARDWSIVACAVDPAHAVAAVTGHRVDACLMDLSFPDGHSGIAGIESVRRASPGTKVVVLTASSDPELIVRAVESGADAVAFKDDDIDHIVDLVERASHGPVERRALPARAEEDPSPQTEAARGEVHELARFLTKREFEVLERMVRGESGRHLAEQMNISYATTRTHIQNLLAKLGVHSRLEAIAFAIKHDLCRPTTDGTARDRSRSSPA